jgi:hypothetical protein
MLQWKKDLEVFSPKSDEVYCLWNFFLRQKNGISNQRLGLFFGPTYHALTRFHMGNNNSSSRRCFNLYWHITTSIVFICCSYMSRHAFWLRHKPYSKISTTARFFVWLSCLIPFDQHEACHIYDKILATLCWYLSKRIQQPKMLDARFIMWLRYLYNQNGWFDTKLFFPIRV